MYESTNSPNFFRKILDAFGGVFYQVKIFNLDQNTPKNASRTV